MSVRRRLLIGLPIMAALVVAGFFYLRAVTTGQNITPYLRIPVILFGVAAWIYAFWFLHRRGLLRLELTALSGSSVVMVVTAIIGGQIRRAAGLGEDYIDLVIAVSLLAAVPSWFFIRRYLLRRRQLPDPLQGP